MNKFYLKILIRKNEIRNIRGTLMLLRNFFKYSNKKSQPHEGTFTKSERTNQTNFVLSCCSLSSNFKIRLSRGQIESRFYAQWNDSELLTCTVTSANMCKGRFQYAESVLRTHPSQTCKGDTVRISANSEFEFPGFRLSDRLLFGALQLSPAYSSSKGI